MSLVHFVRLHVGKELLVKANPLRLMCFSLFLWGLVVGTSHAFAEKDEASPADWEEAGKVTRRPPMLIPEKNIREKRLAVTEDVKELSRTVEKNALRSRRTAERAAAIAEKKRREAEKNAARGNADKTEVGTPVTQ